MFSDILGDFLESMDTSILISSVEHIVDGTWRLSVGKNRLGKTTLHAIPTRKITDSDNVEYTITGFEHDNWIEVESETEPPVGLWTLPKLNFYGGTPKAINIELCKQIESQMPIVWLMEIMQEKVSYDNTKPFITPIARLFYLDSADFRNWTTDEHREEAVRPMRNYADRMIQNMIYSGDFDDPVGSPIFINQARFGMSFNQPKTQDNFSHQSNLFSETVSGVEIRLEIPVRRECYD